MAISVKSADGLSTENVSSNSKGNLGVTLGAVGTGLALLNGGLGNGILGGGTVTQTEAAVGISKYYEDRISDLKDMNAQFTSVREDICQLRERASVGETANTYQNLLNQQAFAFVDTRFGVERKITDYEIQAAVCDFIPASKMLRPEQIGDPYHGVRLNMGYVKPYGFDGCGFNDGCGCNGYRGF